MKRVDFIKNFTIGSSVLLTVPMVFQSCSKSDDLPDPGNGNPNPNPNPDGLTIDLSSQEFSALQTVGGYAYKSDIIIIRSGQSQYLAFSSKCTHEGCTVGYNHAGGTLPCPCHGSVFSNTGSVLQGPAAIALKRYTVTADGTKLIIK